MHALFYKWFRLSDRALLKQGIVKISEQTLNKATRAILLHKQFQKNLIKHNDLKVTTLILLDVTVSYMLCCLCGIVFFIIIIRVWI